MQMVFNTVTDLILGRHLCLSTGVEKRVSTSIEMINIRKEAKGYNKETKTIRTLPYLRSSVCVHFLLTAGFEVFQIRQDVAGDSAGGLEGHSGSHHVLIQTSHCQVRGVGSADSCGAVCP